MSAWVPVTCSACGCTVAAAPAGRAPVVCICGACSPAIVARALAPDATDATLRRELYPLAKTYAARARAKRLA